MSLSGLYCLQITELSVIVFSGIQTHVILITTQIVTWRKATWDNSTTAQRSFYVLHIILFSSESGKKKRSCSLPTLFLFPPAEILNLQLNCQIVDRLLCFNFRMSSPQRELSIFVIPQHHPTHIMFSLIVYPPPPLI